MIDNTARLEVTKRCKARAYAFQRVEMVHVE
jgi:hypothetical protein